MWSRSRPEFFYSALDQRIMVARYTVDASSFRAEKPRLWSEGRFAARPNSYFFDLHPDGQRFAVVKAKQGPSDVKPDKVVFILNFFDYLRRIAPPKDLR
jgi:hypothetical protein